MSGDWMEADEDTAPCDVCGRPLRPDPDVIPEGVAGGPMCGDCYRAREFDETLWELDGP